ncbi:MAG TPA: SpoIIE family protein phosphatase [Firmicutes bacterium]|nr:SpoIIE family protein phosphatase [Bacillota bacterium]
MHDRIYIDANYKSLNKFGEELCGDRVQYVPLEDRFIMVLSDGLGSGVKANILSTLTSKIMMTMMEGGASIEDTVDTVVHTLPVCSVRKLAYSTFAILQIYYETGECYLAEFDCPGCIFIRDGKLVPIQYTQREIAHKQIREARFHLQIGDVLTLLSDGVIFAGVGALLNFGWDWDNVSAFLAERAEPDMTSARLTSLLSDSCNDLYAGQPGDDTTVATVKIIPQKIVNLYSGPPENKEDDARLVTDFMSMEGLRIVCGGSSANLVARELHEQVVTCMDYLDPEVPPIAKIPGIDLVTEGVLTLKKTVDMMREYLAAPTDSRVLQSLDIPHGAAMIAKMILEDCTHLNLFIGKKINPAHQNPNLPVDLSIKLRILDDLAELAKQAGKVVTRHFY